METQHRPVGRGLQKPQLYAVAAVHGKARLDLLRPVVICRPPETRMSTDPFLLARSDDGVVTLTLDRPDRRNALTFEVYRALCDFFREEQLDTSTRVVILTGAGQGFCSGGDVHDIIGALRGAGVRKTLEFAWMTGELVRNMREFDRPIIAAVNGTCAGAGAVIALASDFRVLADDTSLHLLFTKVGLTGADMGAAWLLQRLIGAARTTELLMLGDPLPAAQSLSWGLAIRVAPAERVLDPARRRTTPRAQGHEAHDQPGGDDGPRGRDRGRGPGPDADDAG